MCDKIYFLFWIRLIKLYPDTVQIDQVFQQNSEQSHLK